MATNEEYVAVQGHAIGLDRADINRQGQVEIPEQVPHASHDRREEDEDDEKLGKRHRVRVSISEKKHDATLKIKKTLHIGKPETNVENDLGNTSSVLANPVTEESESRLREKLPKPDKATVKEFVHNPIDTTKEKVSKRGNHEVAANIAAREISHGQDVDLLNAHKKIKEADTVQGKARAEETLDELMKERQNMFVRWTLDRHVTKVRILPKNSFVRRPKEDFMRKDAEGNMVIDWRAYGQHLAEWGAQQYGGQYIGYGMENPTPSKKTIMPNIERLIVASAPFQELVMTTRRVYRWEYPAETGKYLAAYVILWYFDLILPGILSGLVYLVVQRKYYAPTMEDLRQDIERTENQQMTALSLTEFIEKEGDQEWADKIVEEVGPWLMVQLGDMANFFEVARNFYEWRTPTQTMTTLSILIAGILATAVTPAWLLLRVITMGMGVTFFGLFPLAANFPEYRLLASTPKRIFWNIPTHAEWAVKAIQAEGTRYQQTHPVAPIPSTTIAPNSSNIVASGTPEYGHYAASLSSKKGLLTISHSSIHFATRHNEVLFTFAYKDIERLEKIDRMVEQTPPLSKLKSDTGKDLKIVGRDGGGHLKEWVVTSVDLRDQVFSQIVGFSSGVWQVVW